MSDTTRPDNDTSLWEHVYSVSSISKAIHINLLANPAAYQGDPLERGAPDYNKVFRVWGFGFDTLRYLSSSHKVGDVAARRNIIEGIFNDVVRQVEFETPLGNSIYRDDNCQFFLIADMGASLIEELEDLASDIAATRSMGEILPQFEINETATTELTCLPKLIDGLRKRTSMPVQRDVSKLIDRFGGDWSEGICPICRMRPLPQTGADPSESTCNECLRRRCASARERKPEQSVFSSEISDGKGPGDRGRSALIVVRIGLEDWLNGRMIRTSFVTEPRGIRKTLESLGSFRDLRKPGECGHDPKFDHWVNQRLQCEDTYERLLEEFSRVRRDQDSITYEGLFYGRGLSQATGEPLVAEQAERFLKVLDETLNEIAGQPGFPQAPDDGTLLNAVCAKTPTPSTLLDVWETTREFIQGIAGGNESEQEGWLGQILEKRPRHWIRVERLPKARFRENEAIDDVMIDGKSFEVVYRGGNDFWVLNADDVDRLKWKSLELPDGACKILQTDGSPDRFYPWRLISASPDLLVVMVPASKAVDITKTIYDKFLEEFGKAYGRLPIAVANVFFPSYLPMFTVLDAARRVERSFRAMQQHWISTHLRTIGDITLGDGSTQDWHHPYIRLEDETGMDFGTVAGPVAHLSKVGNRRVLIRPNLYNAFWLGSSAMRFALGSETGLQGRQSELPICWEEFEKLAQPSRDGYPPMQLDKLDEDLIGLWKLIKDSGVTDSSLRNVVRVLIDRRQSWRGKDSSGSVAASVSRTVASGWPTELTDRIGGRAFEQAVQLYLHVLKERLATEEASGANN